IEQRRQFLHCPGLPGRFRRVDPGGKGSPLPGQAGGFQVEIGVQPSARGGVEGGGGELEGGCILSLSKGGLVRQGAAPGGSSVAIVQVPPKYKPALTRNR